MSEQPNIYKIYKITAKLKLNSPLLIADGENDGVIDKHILKNKKGEPFIPGTSLAGALRNMAIRKNKEIAELLFGKSENNDNDSQSAIMINDIILKNYNLVLRDGVKIDPYTQSAINGAKYDYEAIEKGAESEKELELIIKLREFHRNKSQEIEEMIKFLADVVVGGILLGALTTKGFGKVKGEVCKVYCYDFTKPKLLKAWLCQEEGVAFYEGQDTGLENENENDLVIVADFAIKSSLIIKGGKENHDKETKTVTLKSGDDFVIPGTSIKGVISKQAQLILDSLEQDKVFLDSLMGCSNDNEKAKSRLYVEEAYIDNTKVTAKPQSRIRIDRFTNAVMSGGLFTSEPIRQDNDEPTVRMKMTVKDCQDYEAGLLLFILKDLWTGVLPLGGEKLIGRGILQGLRAEIAYRGNSFEIIENNGMVINGAQGLLEDCATALVERVV